MDGSFAELEQLAVQYREAYGAGVCSQESLRELYLHYTHYTGGQVIQHSHASAFLAQVIDIAPIDIAPDVALLAGSGGVSADPQTYARLARAIARLARAILAQRYATMQRILCKLHTDTEILRSLMLVCYEPPSSEGAR